MSPPDLTDKTLFPTFNDLPETPSTPLEEEEASSTSSSPTPTLLAQIRDDMTITKPTLILLDRMSVPFALIFDGFEREDGIRFLKAGGFKKGATVMLRGGLARRVPPREDSKSGKGFVRVPRGREGEVGVISGELGRVFEVAGRWKGDGEGRCDTCGKGYDGGDGEKGLLKCTGCGVVRYCSKECQVKGWSEGGHKGDCKVMKGIVGIWGR